MKKNEIVAIVSFTWIILIHLGNTVSDNIPSQTSDILILIALSVLVISIISMIKDRY